MNGVLSKNLRSNALILTHFSRCEILRCELFRIKVQQYQATDEGRLRDTCE